MSVHNPPTIVPIGALTAFLKDFTNADTLATARSQGWALCDGTTPASQGIADPVITTTPDLNGDNRFLRGSDSSGGVGGRESFDYGGLDEAATVGGTHDFVTGMDSQQESGTVNLLNPYYNVVFLLKVK